MKLRKIFWLLMVMNVLVCVSKSLDIRSLSVKNVDNFMAPAVIRLGTDDKLAINFDIIGDQHEYLRYRLVHLNADGKKSHLMESDYLGGFNEAEVNDYAYSSNSFVHYVNYNIEIPNPDMPILASGEYLMEVYAENDPEEILLAVPFSITEGRSAVVGKVTSRTDKGYNTEYQQLSVEIDANGLGAINPYQDLIVTVMQNNRPETLRVLEHPIRVESGKIVYEHAPELIFEAANEYRRFETVRTDYPGKSVDSVKFDGSRWHAWLTMDEPRNEASYVYDSTQHGRFMIDDYNSTDPDLGADYVSVHFTLDAPQIGDGAIYLDGDFTGHDFNDKNLMRYDWQDGLYHAELLLKQGSYNYQYVVVPSNKVGAYPSPIEGNKYETRNEYLVRVYLREPGSRGDRLVGHTVVTFN